MLLICLISKVHNLFFKMYSKGKRYVLPYVRPYYNYRSAKYSNETIAFNTSITENIDGGITFPDDVTVPNGRGCVIVAATDVLGNRKVKNFTIKVTANGNDDQIFGALVYVPEGTNASQLGVTGITQSLYEPNQNIICTFIIPPNCSRDNSGVITSQSAPTQIVVSNKLARNLNTGDKIVLLFSTPNGLYAGDGTGEAVPCVVSGTVNFAIKY